MPLAPNIRSQIFGKLGSRLKRPYEAGKTNKGKICCMVALSISTKHWAPITRSWGKPSTPSAFSFETGEPQGAEGYIQRALAIRVRALGADHADVGFTLYLLGVSIGRHGRREEAAGYYGRALATQEQALDVDDPGSTLGNLRLRADEAGRTEEAREFLRRENPIREKTLYGVDHTDLANSLLALGVDAGEAGWFKEGEEYLLRALGIRAGAPRADHPDVALVNCNLGICAGMAGRPEDAVVNTERALEVNEKAFGVYHPEVMRALLNLATAASTAGRPEEAEGYRRRVLAIQGKKRATKQFLSKSAHVVAVVPLSALMAWALRSSQ